MSHHTLTIRAATARDDAALARLSAREAGWHLGGLALLAEANGAVVAANRAHQRVCVLADPIQPDAVAICSPRWRRCRIPRQTRDVRTEQTLLRRLASSQDNTTTTDEVSK